jgi:hypothetical protein
MPLTRNYTALTSNYILSCALLFLMIQPGRAQAQLTELYAFQYNSATTSNYPDGPFRWPS